MTTINAVNNGLSGATGTGSFVGSNSPTLVTPTLGVATSTSLTFSPTTNGIIGTTTNNNAIAGTVGEFISSVIVSGSGVSFTNNTPTDLTSISLTAGDWNVWGNIFYTFAGGGASSSYGWISSTSATQPDISRICGQAFSSALLGNWGFETPIQRFSLSGTTTIYISGISVVNAGTITASGGIYARRIR